MYTKTVWSNNVALRGRWSKPEVFLGLIFLTQNFSDAMCCFQVWGWWWQHLIRHMLTFHSCKIPCQSSTLCHHGVPDDFIYCCLISQLVYKNLGYFERSIFFWFHGWPKFYIPSFYFLHKYNPTFCYPLYASLIFLFLESRVCRGIRTNFCAKMSGKGEQWMVFCCQ